VPEIVLTICSAGVVIGFLFLVLKRRKQNIAEQFIPEEDEMLDE